MNDKIRFVLYVILTVLVFTPCTHVLGWELAKFPRLANYHIFSEIEMGEARFLSGWNLLILHSSLDDEAQFRYIVSRIKEHNPDIILLIYTSSIETNTTVQPPSMMLEACNEYDWWLRDYQGNLLYNPDFTWSMLINMTNTEAAPGSHPLGIKANEYLAGLMITGHVNPYDYWDGVFYDTFADNLTWMHTDVKDATRNGIPEYDNEINDQEPIFSDLWSAGSMTLLDNTIALKPDVIVIGNGLQKAAVENLNGRMLENFTLSSQKNMHLFCSTHKYMTDGVRPPRVNIVNCWIKDQDPTDYQSMRFALCATLMTDSYFSCDFGSQYHGETIWYDEFSVLSTGDVDARTTTLSNSMSADQTFVRVDSTDGFLDRGVIEIDGEQIYYNSKSGTLFMDCVRGFPRILTYDLSAPHADGSTVIQHYADHTGYLGDPSGPAYEANDPSVILDDLLEAAGWFAEGDEIEAINSRVWRRDFQYGTALVNPTESSALVSGLGDSVYCKINGIQDPVHNNSELIEHTLTIDPGDGYVLILAEDPDTLPPFPKHKEPTPP
jgi:hypothetical protein